METSWRDLGVIVPGGTVLGVAGRRRQPCWLATDAGIFQVEAGAAGTLTACPLANGQPVSLLTALAAAGRTIFAGGALGDVLYTTDGGERWYRGRNDQTMASVTCLAVSPHFDQDGVALAGTHGDGILRTRNGGRSWQLVNFGLEDFTVLALATAPTWGRREPVFAATQHGVYRSPNGGRAWKRAGEDLDGITVQALVVSPFFDEDRTVFAGTEGRGLWVSRDGGRAWEPHNEGFLDTAPTVNALWFAGPALLLGTAEGQILRSQDMGASWRAAATGAGAVLTFGGCEGACYAGLLDQGALRSVDGGKTWQPVPLTARAFSRLSSTPEELFAWGPHSGLWARRAGADWRPALLPEPVSILTLVSAPRFMIGCETGLLVWTGDAGWHRQLEGEIVSTLAVHGEACWAGTQWGAVWHSPDAGESWTSLGAPQSGFPVLDLATDGVMTVAATGGPQQSVLLWLWQDRRWRLWHRFHASVPTVQLQFDLQGLWAAVGATLWRAEPGGWREVLRLGAPILRFLRSGDGNLWVLTPESLWISAAGGDFERVSVPGPPLRDLALDHTGSSLLLLTVGGRLWTRARS
ncbi:MAG: hypothetical protein JXB35_12410 [Anaerolineae bacterium]|nr:hypothetical protein [Anaerolineae bacterium]